MDHGGRVPRAEVSGGGEGCVEYVVGICSAVRVAVRRVFRPSGRNELHRPHRPIVSGVAVGGAAVGIADHLVAGQPAVQHRSQNRGDGGAGRVCPASTGMPRFDAPDTRQQMPGHPALGCLHHQGEFRRAVRVEHDLRDAERTENHRCGDQPCSGGRRGRCGIYHHGRGDGGAARCDLATRGAGATKPAGGR